VEVRPEFPLPDTTWEPTRPFWEGAARHELLLPHCEACGRLAWYPRAECRHCGGETFTWAPVGGRGSLFSWVVVIHPFLPQFRDQVPFVTGLVALDEDPSVRLVTRVVDCEPDALAFEQAMEVVFRPLSFTGVAGQVTAPMFRPAPAS
jgi:uncharacterized OB-fold protein